MVDRDSRCREGQRFAGRVPERESTVIATLLSGPVAPGVTADVNAVGLAELATRRAQK